MPTRFDADLFTQIPELHGSAALSLAGELLLAGSRTPRLPRAIAIAKELLATAHAGCLASIYGAPDELPVMDAAPPTPEDLEVATDLALLDEEFALPIEDEPSGAALLLGPTLPPFVAGSGAEADDAELDPIFLDGGNADAGDLHAGAVLLRPAAVVRAEAQRRRLARTVLVRQIAFYAETVAALVDETRPGTRILAERLLAPIADRNEENVHLARAIATPDREDIAA